MRKALDLQAAGRKKRARNEQEEEEQQHVANDDKELVEQEAETVERYDQSLQDRRVEAWGQEQEPNCCVGFQA